MRARPERKQPVTGRGQSQKRGPGQDKPAAVPKGARPADPGRPGRVAELRRALAALRADDQPDPGADAPPARAFVHSRLLGYQDLVGRIRAVVREALPRDATVAVVSKGDNDLLRLDGRTAWHFPRAEDGAYIGYHPADSDEAIRHLEAARGQGAQYLLVPQTYTWWLDFYGQFKHHLDARCRLVARVEDACLVYALDGPGRAGRGRDAGAADGQPAARSAAVPEQEGDLRVQLARALAAAGRADEARFVLNEGLRFDPGHPGLLVELMIREDARGNAVAADRCMAAALSAAPDDYAVNFEVARLAWARGRLDVVEERLARLVRLFPDDRAAADELVKLFCARIEGQNSPDPDAVDRLLALLGQPAVNRAASPATRLRAAEALGGAGATRPALALLEDGLRRLDFQSEVVHALLGRLVRPIVPDPTALPLNDRPALAVYLTHAGNGFAATSDAYRSQACYLLAAAADPSAQAPLFNLAFQDMAGGRPAAALERLARARRLYPDETARIMWPAQNGVPWPHAPFDMAAAFEKLKPAGKKWPRISVVTPSFNQAGFIEETLLSVFNQNYPDLEVIVVDGNSTDGTVDILRRYEHKMARLIVEPDDGQTDAINKGMKLVTGELIYWINSDDLLGPGALFMVALTYLEDDADLIAGFCHEHNERRFGIINLPAANRETFNLECLGNLFDYWFKGHFFYQPECAFTRRILEKVGGQICDKTNHFVMDYEFWLRIAQARGTLATVHWPTGLFRKYPQQKSADSAAMIIEQGQIRDKYVVPRPSFERTLVVRRRIGRALAAPEPRVTVVSTRAGKIFSPDTARELRETFGPEGYAVEFHGDVRTVAPGENDLVILLVHLYKEYEVVRKLREGGHKGPVVGWYWDNHHHVFDNFRASADLDVVIPGHAFAGHYLRSRHAVMADSVPLCVTQWTAAEASRFFAAHGDQKRSDTLYGGFVRYATGRRRNKLISELIADGMQGIYFLEEDALQRYFGLPLGERFREWAGHKVSLSLPLQGDLSQRLFDALLAGQVPLVPNDIHDLDGVIPREVQEQLPIVRFEKYSVAAVREAHTRALKLFDRQGAEGVLRRHQFALENYMFRSCIRAILQVARKMAIDA